MDCRSFRKKHLAYVDDTLPAVEMSAMRRHVDSCAACARHDTAIRRGLLVVRNLPTIAPSADFHARLRARLAAERQLPPAPAFRGPGLRGFLAVAASIVGIGFLTVEARERLAPSLIETRVAVAEDTSGSSARPGMPGLAYPVSATRDARAESAEEQVADPMLMASASAGVPIWPALMLAQEAPMQFARVQFRRASDEE